MLPLLSSLCLSVEKGRSKSYSKWGRHCKAFKMAPIVQVTILEWPLLLFFLPFHSLAWQSGHLPAKNLSINEWDQGAARAEEGAPGTAHPCFWNICILYLLWYFCLSLLYLPQVHSLPFLGSVLYLREADAQLISPKSQTEAKWDIVQKQKEGRRQGASCSAPCPGCSFSLSWLCPWL